MDKVKNFLRMKIGYWQTLWGVNLPVTSLDDLVEGLSVELNKYCVDISPKEDYPEICAYCGRPSETKYG